MLAGKLTDPALLLLLLTTLPPPPPPEHSTSETAPVPPELRKEGRFFPELVLFQIDNIIITNFSEQKFNMSVLSQEQDQLTWI